MKISVWMGFACAGLLTAVAWAADAGGNADRCNVIWTSPGKSAADSMPMGNGELGINLWVEENGDLLFYLSRNDSHSEMSQLCKAGEVRVSLSPNPFVAGRPFRQELRLRDGVCEIIAGEGNARVRLRVFVDAAHPVVHVSGESAAPVTVTAKIESWRTEKQRPRDQAAWWTMKDGPTPYSQAPDVFPPARPDAVSWFHRNEESIAFESTVSVQSLESIRHTLRDPLLHRTFGGWIIGTGFKPKDDRTLATTAPVKSFSLRVASPCTQMPTADDWLNLAGDTASRSSDPEKALERTLAWWHGFWDRSWVDCAAAPGAEISSNTQPLRVGPAAPGKQPPMSIGETVITGRPKSAQEIAADAGGEPKITPPVGLQVPDFAQGVTIEAWINPGPKPGGVIVDKGNGRNGGFVLDIIGWGWLHFTVGDFSVQTPTGTIKAGKWQHVAATYDPKGSILALYVDGRLVAGKGTADMTVGKAYAWTRYLFACAGRGAYPIKFNGSIFTVEPAPMGVVENPDWRKWGDCHWWQNVRIPYHAMLAAGDYDLMEPLFAMYESFRPFTEARSKLYYNAEGCYFGETSTFWGTYSNFDYGWKRDGLQPGDVQCKYWRYAWNQGLELVSLMLDYHDYTGDGQFLKEHTLPMAGSVLKYFDTRFRKDAAGRLVIDPTQSAETYWDGVVNDTPSVAGLTYVTQRLCALPPAEVPAEQRRFFERMKAAVPPVPMATDKLDGREVRKISVAEKFSPRRSNCENTEQYAIWPFRLFGLERPMLEEARNSYALRVSHLDVGWGYDSNVAALLGLTDEAERILKVKMANSNGMYRWPATWGPNFDWLPDQCHGGNLMNTVNYMLLQDAGDRILLLPAWPKDWDVSFKLHAPRQTTVEATVRGGKVTRLKVTPESRRKDIVLSPSFVMQSQP